MNIETLAARYQNLPTDWKVVPLGEILTNIVGGGTPSRNDPSYWNGDIPWLSVKDMRTRRPATAQESITARAVQDSATSVIPADTVITATRVGLGKVIRVPFPAAINQDLKALIAGPELDKSYLEYWIVSVAQFLESIGSGTTVKGIRLETLRQLPFPLAPLKTQREIVAEIEKQFSRLDEAVANLKRVKANLKRYKAAVLKAAVEGRLVPTEGDWKTELLGDVAISIRNGFSGKPDAENGTPILRISAVRPMALDVADVRYLSGGVDEYGTFLISSGDVLFTRYNGNRDFVGVCACVPPNIAPTAYPDKLIRVRVPASTLLPEFLTISASTGVARAYLESKIRTTAGQSGISGGDLKALPLLLPSVVDQRQIVDEVERRFSLIRGVETQTDANLKRAERMRQSILGRALGQG